MARKRTTYLGTTSEACACVPVVQINLGGGVTSVNGMTGDVVLDASDIDAISADDIAANAEVQDVLDEVFGDEGGGIATNEEAKSILDDVFG